MPRLIAILKKNKTDKPIPIGELRPVKLPANGLLPLANYYESYEGEKIPMLLVAVYNAEQLAIEIAKHLKGCTDNNGEGNNASK